MTGRARAYAAAQAMTRELRASEERYRRIVYTAGEGIWLLDAAQRLAYVNPRIVQWLGLPERALLGRAVDDPDRWVLSCEWADVGSGRRGLTSGLVREAIMPLMNRLPDVECTYEIVRSV